MTGPSIVILVRVPPRPHSTSTTATTDLHTSISQPHNFLSLHDSPSPSPSSTSTTTCLSRLLAPILPYDPSDQGDRQSGPRPFPRGRFLFFLLDPVRDRIPSSTGLFELRFSFLPCIIPSMVKLHHHHRRHPRVNKLLVAHHHLNRE